MTLEQRVAAWEAAVKQLGVVVQADLEGLRITHAEVARQGRRQAHDSVGWHASSNGHR
jgi:hypothetical protein